MDPEVWKQKIQLAIEPFDGLTTDEIAGVLELQGVRGRPQSGTECVLANYFAMQVGETVRVGASSVIRLEKSDDGVTLSDVVGLSPELDDLYHGFDAGWFPNLIG